MLPGTKVLLLDPYQQTLRRIPVPVLNGLNKHPCLLLQCIVYRLKSFTWNIDSLSHISQTLCTSSSVFLACSSWAAWMIGFNVSGTFVSCNKFSAAHQQQWQQHRAFGVVNCKVLQDYTVQNWDVTVCCLGRHCWHSKWSQRFYL